MTRRLLLGAVGLLLGALLGHGVWLVLHRGDDTPSAQVAAGTPEGSLTFTIPRSWKTLACESDEGDCVRVTTPGMVEAQAATVSFIPPNPVEGTPVDVLANPDVTVPGAVRTVVDGLPAARIDPTAAGQDTTLVAGRARTEAGHTFMVVCPVGGDAARAREVCDQIVRTLKVTR